MKSKITLILSILCLTLTAISPALATSNSGSDEVEAALRQVLVEKQKALTQLEDAMNNAQPFGANLTIIPEAGIVASAIFILWSLVPESNFDGGYMSGLANDLKRGFGILIGGPVLIGSAVWLLIDNAEFQKLKKLVAEKQQDLNHFLNEHPELK